MNRQERIERLAERQYNQTGNAKIPWQKLYEEKECWRESARQELDFLATLGAVWVADDQKILLSKPDKGYDMFTFGEMVEAGWRKVEGA